MDRIRPKSSFVFRFFLAAAAALFICLFSSVTAQAAARLVLLKNEKTYTSYDVTGNGAKDKVRYSAKLGRIYVNGKAQKLFTGVSDPARVRVFYYSLNRSNTFILVEYAKSAAVKISSGYRYSGGRFKKACEPMGAYTSCRIGRLSGNNLILYTSPSSGAATLSFTGISGKPFEYEETYKINTTKHTVVRASNYAKLRSAKSYYYATNKNIKLSTSAKTLNTSGPTLEYGQKVSLGRVFFSYTGSDAKSGTKIYELKFAGKTGWMKETSGRKFVKTDPLASKRSDFYKDVAEADFFRSISVSAGLNRFIARTEAKEDPDAGEGIGEVYKGTNFTVTYYSDFFDPTEQKKFELENTGNKLVTCAGAAIGMTADEAAKAYEATLRKRHAEAGVKHSFSKDTLSDGVVLRFCTGEITWDEEGECYEGSVLEDELTLKIKNGVVSSYVYKQTISEGAND